MFTPEDKGAKVDVSRRNFLRGSATLAVSLPLAGLVSKASVAHAAETAKKGPMAKALFVERKNCTGCNSCVFACSLYHEGVVRPSVARIHVRRVKGLVDVPIICWHCPDAPCVAACPQDPKVIAKDKETNVIRYVSEKDCLGAKCHKCIEACPPQFLRAHPETEHPLFCDLCGGDPQCVKACARQSKENGETLRSDAAVGGIHWNYRDVTPEDAAEGLMLNMFYPNTDGSRR